jgi:hypothetical protein
MRAMYFLIDKTGAFINPTSISTLNPASMNNNPAEAQITLTYYDAIQTLSNGQIVPITPVISGMSGTITVQVRPNPDSAWADIQDNAGVLNLVTGDNVVYTGGVISQIKITPAGVTGCNYISVQLDRGN